MQSLSEVPGQFTKRYWKPLQFNPWGFQQYFPLIFEYLRDYSGPVPTIEQAERVVLDTFDKSVGAISTSAWLPPDATRDLAQQLRNHLSTRQAQPPRQQTPVTHLESEGARAARRQKIIQPMLQVRHWTIDDWRADAKVDWKTANNYYTGKTTPRLYIASRLAGSLGLEHLPD